MTTRNKTTASAEQSPQGSSVPIPPLMYADGIIGIGVGAQVCRLELGREVAPNAAMPTGTLVIPTGALLAFVRQFIDSINTAEFRDALSKSQNDVDSIFKALQFQLEKT